MSNTRVFNVTRRFSMKHKQAVKAVENCACAWVEFGVSVRDLTLQESIAERNRQAVMRQPLPLSELPGLIYQPRPGQEAAARNERSIAAEASQWAALQVA